jgi:hypothetical protein
MRATAWNNGSHSATGAGYGLRISRQDRDRFFDPQWQEVVFDLGGEAEATTALSESFWRSCSELRSADIGRWLLRHDLAPWPRGRPPVVTVTHIEGNRFLALPAAGN